MKILKFYSNTCGPCKALEKNLQEAGVDYESIDVEADNSDELIDTYSIRGIPTLIKLNDKDEVIDKYVGVMNVEQLKKWCK